MVLHKISGQDYVDGLENHIPSKSIMQIVKFTFEKKIVDTWENVMINVKPCL